jgi:pimeloyl-ACP methyl ester carboxylesterase
VIRVPVMVVVGSDDQVTPVSEAQRMAEGIPRADMVVIPRSGHLSSLEQSDEFNRALSAFLSRL